MHLSSRCCCMHQCILPSLHSSVLLASVSVERQASWQHALLLHSSLTPMLPSAHRSPDVIFPTCFWPHLPQSYGILVRMLRRFRQRSIGSSYRIRYAEFPKNVPACVHFEPATRDMLVTSGLRIASSFLTVDKFLTAVFKNERNIPSRFCILICIGVIITQLLELSNI